MSLGEIKGKKLAYLLGEDDAGKTTLATSLANRLSAKGRIALIDADVGQGSLPLTVTLFYIESHFASFSDLEVAEREFIPGYDLMRFHQRYVMTLAEFAERSRREARYVLIDPTGLIRPDLKRREIEAVAPDLVIALERGGELEPILSLLNCTVARYPIPEEARRRSQRARKTARGEKFRQYFRGAIRREIRAEPIQDWRSRLVALYAEGFLGLGITVARSASGLMVLTPVMADIKRLEFGHLKVDPERGEIGR